MVGESTLLWVGDDPVPAGVRAAATGRWHLVPCSTGESLAGQLQDALVVLICPNGRANDPHYLARLLDELDHSEVVAVFLLPRQADAAWALLRRRRGQFLCLPDDTPAVELRASLETARALQPSIGGLQTELSAARRLLAGHTQSLDEIDEEMRLAARLQRDFLPRRLPEVGPVRFGVLYRPAGWVSGDIYDAVRLDETHVGFHVVDAVGHGTPAALFTMFIKKALVTKRIAGSSYEIVPPHESLTDLNADICEQDLSAFQFCTCVYCVLDTQSLELTYSRAGHPEPLLFRADGPVERLAAPGSLLGVFPHERYTSRQVQLAPGDRLVLYTDGVDTALPPENGKPRSFAEALSDLARLPRDELLLELKSRLDAYTPPAAENDDVTIVVVDIER